MNKLGTTEISKTSGLTQRADVGADRQVLGVEVVAFGKCIRDEDGVVDEYGRHVLRLKNYADSVAIEYLFKIVNPQLETGCPVVTVPSSTKGRESTGMSRLVQRLCAPGSRRIDATTWLHRKVSVKPNHMGGSRDIKKHSSSIEISAAAQIYGKTILLLDDVYTTGNSLRACAQLLDTEGATLVKPHVLLFDEQWRMRNL